MRWGELVTADKSTVIFEPFPGTIIVEDGEGDGCFADPPWTGESDWGEAFCEIDDLVD